LTRRRREPPYIPKQGMGECYPLFTITQPSV
jgi:hypothetical protein